MFFQWQRSEQVICPLIGSRWRGCSNLIGCGGISTGVSSQAGQLLLHAEVGALAHAEERGGHCQRHQDEEHAEDGEQQELAWLHPGLLHHGDLSQAAPLEDTCRKMNKILSAEEKHASFFSPLTNVCFIWDKILHTESLPQQNFTCFSWLWNNAALTSSSSPLSLPLFTSTHHRHCLTRPHSLTSSNSGLIVCIYTQSAPITSPCPVLSPHCGPL